MAAAMSDRGPLRILFAEDEPFIQMMVTAELTDAGHEVVEVASGDDALRVLDDDTGFDVLLTDIRMPGRTDGWDLAEAARQLKPGIPVVYASGYSLVELRPVPGGVLLPKPYLTDVLLTTIAALVATGPGSSPDDAGTPGRC